MVRPSAATASSILVPPDERLTRWERLTARANSAARMGHVLAALATCHEALALVRDLVALPPAGRADDVIAALIVSRHNLADLHAEAGCIDLAAAQRCTAHEELLRLVTGRTGQPDLQRAALRHSRETHAALLAHLETHGAHPAITRALQAGCLMFAAGPSALH